MILFKLKRGTTQDNTHYKLNCEKKHSP